MLAKIVCIFLGGGTGCVLRWLVGGAVPRYMGEHFPTGTIAVNIIGCFLIGFLASALTGPWCVREEFRLAIIVGLLGGFTTFSSFALESYNLADGGKFALAAVNMLGSNAFGLLAVWLGAKLSTVL